MLTKILNLKTTQKTVKTEKKATEKRSDDLEHYMKFKSVNKIELEDYPVNNNVLEGIQANEVQPKYWMRERARPVKEVHYINS